MIAFPVEQILHTMNAGYALYEFITDENGQPCDYVFIDINPAFEKLTGFRAVDIVGKRITQILPAADAIHFIERYRPVAFGGQAMRFEKPSINMDKSLRIYAFSPAEVILLPWWEILPKILTTNRSFPPVMNCCTVF
ncbi:MAG TPA: PAS domain-containing protein [Syntrophomonas sp.]|nr:PAS domain-containing protein [Syntrophomonas sp.]